MTFMHAESHLAERLGVSLDKLRDLRTDVLVAGVDYDKRGKRLLYSDGGVRNLAAASGLDDAATQQLLSDLQYAVPQPTALILPPPEDPAPLRAVVHQHFINPRQIAIRLLEGGAIERCRVKHSGHFKDGDAVLVRPSPMPGDTFYILDQKEPA